MDYYLNEYSLRGQFKDIEEFYESLREYTLPVLKKIESEKKNIIWKKDTFWQSEICNGITLLTIPKKKNERTEERFVLHNKLIKLAYEEQFWKEEINNNLKIEEYKFDKEYSEKFDKENCFIKAIENEGRIVSFIHYNYEQTQLPVVIKYNNEKSEYNIDNIINILWWKNEPEIKTWYINGKYLVQVRAREFDYHPPHFHVIYNEYAAVFKLSNGELYKASKRKKWTDKMTAEVQEWYHSKKDELQDAWNNLHSSNKKEDSYQH